MDVNFPGIDKNTGVKKSYQGYLLYDWERNYYEEELQINSGHGVEEFVQVIDYDKRERQTYWNNSCSFTNVLSQTLLPVAMPHLPIFFTPFNDTDHIQPINNTISDQQAEWWFKNGDTMTRLIVGLPDNEMITADVFVANTLVRTMKFVWFYDEAEFFHKNITEDECIPERECESNCMGLCLSGSCTCVGNRIPPLCTIPPTDAPYSTTEPPTRSPPSEAATEEPEGLILGALTYGIIIMFCFLGLGVCVIVIIICVIVVKEATPEVFEQVGEVLNQSSSGDDYESDEGLLYGPRDQELPTGQEKDDGVDLFDSGMESRGSGWFNALRHQMINDRRRTGTSSMVELDTLGSISGSQSTIGAGDTFVPLRERQNTLDLL